MTSTLPRKLQLNVGNLVHLFIMRSVIALTALLGLSNAAAIQPRKVEPELFKIELGPGDIRTVTEEEKWALKAVSSRCSV